MNYARGVHPLSARDQRPRFVDRDDAVGAGTAGLVTAAGAAGLGAKVALIERDYMGGDCLNVGCVPSKALIRAGCAVLDVREAGAFGVQVPLGVRVDFAAIMERMRRLRAKISQTDSAERFKGLGVDVFFGQGRFSGPDAVEMEGKTLRFSKAVIATGARAAAPPIPGLRAAGYLTNDVRAGTDKIVGATIVARHAGEMLPEVSLAVGSGIGLGKIANVIHTYPTQAEAIRKLGDAYNRSRLTPLVKKVFAWWLRRTG